MSAIAWDRIILFDGVCNLCTSSVSFVLRHEKAPTFRFAALQSTAGAELLRRHGFPAAFRQAVIYIEPGALHIGSTAALKIGQQLKFPWSLLAGAGLRVPISLRDRIYRRISQNRYRWFGKGSRCLVATQALSRRFL